MQGKSVFDTFALDFTFAYNCNMAGRRRLGNTTNPLIVIQWIVAIGTLVGGAYMLSPFLRMSIKLHGATAFVQTLGSETGVIIFAAFFLFTAVVMIYGIVSRKVKWRLWGLFLNGLARLYVLIGTWLAVGILPLTWLSSAVVLAIVVYIWGRIRKRGAE